MKTANALPLVLGSPYTSAMMPATMAIGALAKTPQNILKTSSAGQLGARAQAMVKMEKAAKVAMVRCRRPRCSLRGPQMMGPKT